MTCHSDNWDQRQESSHVDKSEWGPGTWQEEPDRIEWRYDGTPRFPLLIVRAPGGALCGYVGVPPGHPLHGKSDGDHDVCWLDCHGGITYAAPCQEGGHICHVPREGESPDVWWLGFDCAHLRDLCPKHAAEDRARGHDPQWCGDYYRSVAYVRREVEHLAKQCANIAKGIRNEQD